MSPRKVNFHTLGCKLNFSETSTLAREFARGGFERVAADAPADICVINSCSVTEHADKKCRNLIRKLHRRNPQAIIAVTGCYAQLKPQEIAAIEGVDLVLSNNDKGELHRRVAALGGKGRAQVFSCDTDSLTSFFAAFSSGDRTRAFLKVQDGCDYCCSYCTIHYARGASRNMPIADLVDEARQIAAAGQREIVITGVNTGDFGRTTGETFLDLLRALEGVEGIERYRISSIEPNLLTDEIIDFVASSRRFMPHFHIPLQSGDDEVLKLMRRHYDSALFASKIERIRRVIPDAFIGVDLIVGARGETPERFARSKAFVESIDISRLHVFTYSERPGTRALEIEHVVTQEEKHRRTREMLALSTKKLDNFSRRFVGTIRPVLIERPKDSLNVGGFTDNYLRIVAEVSPDIDTATLDNRIVDVEITDVVTEDETVKARLVS